MDMEKIIETNNFKTNTLPKTSDSFRMPRCYVQVRTPTFSSERGKKLCPILAPRKITLLQVS